MKITNLIKNKTEIIWTVLPLQRAGQHKDHVLWETWVCVQFWDTLKVISASSNFASLYFSIPPFHSTFKQTMFSLRAASSSQWLSERFSVLLSAAVLYLPLICIDLSHGLPFYWCQRAERALQYTMFSLRSYRAGNEKQMAPLCRDVQQPGQTGLWSEGRNWKGHEFNSLDNDERLLPPLA